jgi:uncharacterized protein
MKSMKIAGDAGEETRVVILESGEEAFAALAKFANDVAVGDDGNASLHVHDVLGLSDGTTRGGLTFPVRN